MNRWQRAFMEQMGYKNVPRGKYNKWCYEVLGKVAETVTVQFPTGPKTYVVDETHLDMPNGYIDVLALAANLELWVLDRKYKVTSSGRVQH